MYLDGGVRQGTDVLKALALGARAVFVGRPVLWGLACGGRQGVEQVLGMLREELKLAMQLAGKEYQRSIYIYIYIYILCVCVCVCVILHSLLSLPSRL